MLSFLQPFSSLSLSLSPIKRTELEAYGEKNKGVLYISHIHSHGEGDVQAAQWLKTAPSFIA